MKRKTSLTGIILVAGLLTLSGLALLRPDSESLVFESSESSQIAVPQTAIVTGDGREQDIQRGLDFLDEAYERNFYLETVLLHGEPGDKKAAVRELKKSSDANVVALLSLALADPDVRVRQAAFEALSEIGGEEAMSAIASAMHQSDPKVRASAAEALATTEGYSAPNYLEIALHDDNPRVRQAAIEALGVVGDSRSINIISAALRDPDEAVRERAAEILDELNDDAMFEVFYSTF